MVSGYLNIYRARAQATYLPKNKPSEVLRKHPEVVWLTCEGPAMRSNTGFEKNLLDVLTAWRRNPPFTSTACTEAKDIMTTLCAAPAIKAHFFPATCYVASFQPP